MLPTSHICFFFSAMAPRGWAPPCPRSDLPTRPPDLNARRAFSARDPTLPPGVVRRYRVHMSRFPVLELFFQVIAWSKSGLTNSFVRSTQHPKIQYTAPLSKLANACRPTRQNCVAERPSSSIHSIDNIEGRMLTPLSRQVIWFTQLSLISSRLSSTTTAFLGSCMVGEDLLHLYDL